jgi:hypothetical protein
LRVVRRIISVFILLCLVFKSYGQLPVPGAPGSNLRKKLIEVKADSIRLDTLSIIPGTLSVTEVDTAFYRLDFVQSMLYWKQRPPTAMVAVTYRVFPYKLNPVAQTLNFDSLVTYSIASSSPLPIFQNEGRGLFNFGNIQASGSFGRQIGFGNNQDAVLNSTLNIQLSGMLGDSIELQAAITDNNIPIQPDGNTQQLNEFDEVYIRFRKKNWQLNIGDIDIRQNQSYFLRFYKRLQGLSFQTTNEISPRLQSNTLVSGSIAKGKFTRNVIQGLEGNQGPYRLQGANNEVFFIVLANTERVFIDGELLQRGEDQDYVINYNTAEVTFTPRRMITKDSRIQIEFEYADRNFLNANIYLNQEVVIDKKATVRIGFFNNSDAKNSSINQVLDTRQKQFLSEIGDSVQRAFYPSAALDTFAAGKVLYEKVYYNPGTGLDSFYRYSTDPDFAKYSLAFTDVGQGNGNYVPGFNGANGKVFEFIAPVSGVKQGRYEPVLLLVTPKKQQLLNLGLDYQVNKNTMVKVEGAMSNYDVNTFSRLDNGDDNGYAGKFQVNNTALLKKKNKLQLLTSGDYEYVQKKFRPLERLRSVEFSRDWGLPLLPEAADEQIIRASAGLRDQSGHTFNYRVTSYNRSSSYNGLQHAVLHQGDFGGWRFNNEFVLTSFETGRNQGAFLRPTIDINKELKQLNNWRLGFRYALEHNKVKDKTTDSLTADAFSFDTYSVYFRSDERKRNRYGATFFTRADKYKYPAASQFTKGDRSYNLNLQAELLGNAARQLYVNTTFRKLQIYDKKITTQTEDQTILGRLEYVMNEWKGLLTGNVLYEVGSGQEQKRDYAYLEVPAGTGQFAWIDYNEDGLQQLNEFELAAFPDQAKFIRIFTPTNEYIKANYTTLNYSVALNPRVKWGNNEASPFQQFIGKFNLASSMQITKKSLAKGDFEFNPFKYGVSDTGLITLNTVLVNTLSFNRFGSKWGADISNLRSGGKSLLTYGYESRRSRDWSMKLRWNLSRAFQLLVNSRYANNELRTDNSQFDNRNYDLNSQSVEPVLTFIRGTTFRLATGYKYETKRNEPIFGGEKAVSSRLTAETKYNILQNTSISGKFSYEDINYKSAGGSTTTTVSYIMLDGLLPGKNFLWNLTLTKRLLNNLELNFQYDGRKPGSTRTIHTGRATITALL